MSRSTRRRVPRKMLATAATVAVLLLVTEKVSGFLLAALAVQLALNGLSDVGVLHLAGH